MYFLEKVNMALQNLEYHKVLLKDPVRPNEGPWLVMDPVGGSSIFYTISFSTSSKTQRFYNKTVKLYLQTHKVPRRGVLRTQIYILAVYGVLCPQVSMLIQRGKCKRPLGILLA